MLLETISGHLYDYPHYYDVVFGADWKKEFRFLERCFELHIDEKVRTIFEPACGTGRLLYRLAQAGYQVSGLDLNEKSVEYCNTRLKKMGYPAAVVVKDMSQFKLRRPVDAAFNMINSVRHLMSEESAAAHFECMGEAVRPKGIYIVGLHLSPTVGTPIEEETWQAKRGSVTVHTHMWTKERDLQQRVERCGLTINVHTPKQRLRIEDELHFRTYNWRQLLDVMKDSGYWQIESLYDFSYEMDVNVEPNAKTEDIVVVLRRL